MSAVTATRIFSPLQVRRIMVWPSMWETVAEDGQKPEDFRPDVERDCWLSMTAGETEIGLYLLQQRNGVMVEIHAQVLPEYRKQYSKASGHAALQWILDNIPDCQKVIAWVPAIYQNVKDFTCSFGFQVEGVNRKSYLKHGELHDQWLLGILRSEIPCPAS